jgi:hypothetical protein
VVLVPGGVAGPHHEVQRPGARQPLSHVRRRAGRRGVRRLRVVLPARRRGDEDVIDDCELGRTDRWSPSRPACSWAGRWPRCGVGDGMRWP